MEAVIEHVLEPEIAGHAPRRLHLPIRARLLLAVASLLLGLFVVGSGRALWEGIKLSWLAHAGHTVSGTVAEIRTVPSGLKDTALRQTALRYTVSVPTPNGPVLKSGWIALGEPPAVPNPENQPSRMPSVPAFRLGQPVPLRVVLFGGAVVCQPWGPGAGSRIWTLFLTGGLVMAVSLFLLRRLTRWAGSRLHLLRFGTAAIGTITHTRSEAEDMVRYFLRYGYPGGPESGREEQVSADQWRTFHVGQPVTVLHDPKDPAHAGLYALIAQK